MSMIVMDSEIWDYQVWSLLTLFFSRIAISKQKNINPRFVANFSGEGYSYQWYQRYAIVVACMKDEHVVFIVVLLLCGGIHLHHLLVADG